MARHTLLVFALLASVGLFGIPHVHANGIRGFIRREALGVDDQFRTSDLGDQINLKLVLENTQLKVQKRTDQSSTTTQELDLNLERRSAWTSSSKVFVLDGDRLEEQVVNIDSSCHYVGNVSDDGASFVSLDFCHPISGLLGADGKQFLLQGEGSQDGDNKNGKMRIRLTPMYDDDEDLMTEEAIEDEEAGPLTAPLSQGLNDELLTRVDQGTPPIVEIGAYVDRFFLKTIEKKYNVKTTEEQTKFMIKRYNSVAAFYNQNGIGIHLKLLQLWKTDPAFYDLKKLSESQPGYLLSSFCGANLEPKLKLDLKVLYFRVPLAKSRIAGLAWVNNVCSTKRNCLISKNVDDTRFNGDVHEIGHQLGLGHNTKNTTGRMSVCNDDPGPKGFMGGGGSRWQACYRKILETTLTPSRKPCLYQNNVQNYPVLNETPITDSPPIG